MLAPIRPRPTMPSWTGGTGGVAKGGGNGEPSDMGTGCHVEPAATVRLVSDLQRDLDGMRAAQALLGAQVRDLTDAHARGPSLLPEWSVGHVLTHLARNADGFRLMVDAAARG